VLKLKKKQFLRQTVNVGLILNLGFNDKFATVNNKLSKIPPSTAVHKAMRVEIRVLFVSVDLHVSLCRQQQSQCERAMRLVCPTCCSKLRPSYNPRNRNVTTTAPQTPTAHPPNHAETHTHTRARARASV